MMRLCLVLAFVVAVGGDGWAGKDSGPPAAPSVIDPGDSEPRLELSISATEVMLGDSFHLFVTVEHERGTTASLAAAIDLGKGLEEVRRTSSAIEDASGTVRTVYEIEVMAFEVGDLVVPPIPVVIVRAGKAGEWHSAAGNIRVGSLVGDGDETLREMSAPVMVWRRDFTLVYIGAGVAGSALFMWLLIWGVGVRRRVLARRPVRPKDVPGSPEERALARLDVLEGSGALDADQRRPAYVDLSEIVRDYMGRKFNFPALDLTTFEILAHLEDRGLSEVAEAMADWLRDADMVKFADADATPEDARDALYHARLWIEKLGAEPVKEALSDG